VGSLGHRRRRSKRGAVACLTSAAWNPYLGLLYDGLAREGVPFEPGARLKVGWLLGARRRVRWLHVHWPQALYRLSRGPGFLRGPLSWLKLAVFAARLAVARSLEYRVVWTIHQVLPHDEATRIDLAAARLLAWDADVLVAHDRQTADHAARILGAAAEHVEIVPHGSYVGVYPPGRGRTAARAELGIDAERVALCFGQLRAYKDVGVLLDAFTRVESPAVLVVAGHPKDPEVVGAVGAAAADDSRIRARTSFVPSERVADLFAVADLAVVPRGDGGTSGSLILALSFGVPVVAADRPNYRGLLANGEAGWLFEPGDPESLARALDVALSAPEDELKHRADQAAAQAAELEWEESARLLAGLLHGRYT
jgi:glycosyltransferase involved in cell wall biosynthesis